MSDESAERAGGSEGGTSGGDDERTEQWEYHVLRPPREPAKKEARDPTTEFNELGADGWKLIETVEYVGGGTKFLVFRRPAGAGGDGPDDAEDADA